MTTTTVEAPAVVTAARVRDAAARCAAEAQHPRVAGAFRSVLALTVTDHVVALSTHAVYADLARDVYDALHAVLVADGADVPPVEHLTAAGGDVARYVLPRSEV